MKRSDWGDGHQGHEYGEEGKKSLKSFSFGDQAATHM